VAGRFYPADPRQLAAEVDQLLASASASPCRAKALIAPHAGYVYSGATAGLAFSTLAADAASIDRVVLLGPSHFVPLAGLAASRAPAFETPLGRVPVDLLLRDRVLRLDRVRLDDRAHAREHSLEVMLPFLQRTLGDFTVLPLAVGDTSPEAVAEVLELCWGNDSTRIVVSSDLSHYHDYRTAQTIDRGTRQAIERLDPAAIGPDRACGCYALNGLLEAARRRQLEVTTLAVCNSGDTAGPRDRVVGYGAWVFG
jgi:AmmeMemoRadiSam system protein B